MALHTLVVGLSLAGVTSWVLCHEAPRPICVPPPAPAPDRRLRYQEFDGRRALATACFLSRAVGPRPGGSANERRVATYLAGRLRKLGYETRSQQHVPLGRSGLTTCNVIGLRRHPGEPRRVLIGAHIDSIRGKGCVGANDNASGVGVTLELARLLAAADVPFSVEIAFFGAEERQWGGSVFGSGYYVATAARGGELPLAMICVDMVGRGDRLYLRHGGPREECLAALFTHSAHRLDLPLRASHHPTGRKHPRGSDHVPFVLAGVPSAWLQCLPDPANHTKYDLPENLDAGALAQAGQLLAHALLSVTAEDLDVISGQSRGVSAVACEQALPTGAPRRAAPPLRGAPVRPAA